jgi:DNA-binding transcriptional MocR family regulator
VEDPGYFVLFEQLRGQHVNLIPIPRTPSGPDVAALEAACRTHRPRAFFTQTLLHNPTGSNTEPAVCHRILSCAEQFGFAIIEDDVYGDLHTGPAVRLAQIDGLRHVIFVSSFTKLIGPALRVGYIAADPAMITRIIERKVLSVLTHSALLESFVAEVLDSGRYRKHLETLRGRLSRMRRDAIQALSAAGITFDHPTGEGMFLWGRVPDTTAIDELVRGAQEQSILLAKGALFSPSKQSRQWLRFNVAHSTAPPLIRYLKSAA